MGSLTRRSTLTQKNDQGPNRPRSGQPGSAPGLALPRLGSGGPRAKAPDRSGAPFGRRGRERPGAAAGSRRPAVGARLVLGAGNAHRAAPHLLRHQGGALGGGGLLRGETHELRPQVALVHLVQSLPAGLLNPKQKLGWGEGHDGSR